MELFSPVTIVQMEQIFYFTKFCTASHLHLDPFEVCQRIFALGFETYFQSGDVLLYDHSILLDIFTPETSSEVTNGQT